MVYPNIILEQHAIEGLYKKSFKQNTLKLKYIFSHLFSKYIFI